MSIRENITEYMLQAFDKDLVTERQRWMKLLSRAPEAMLEEGLLQVPKQSHTWLRPPETGLYMVQARVGGSGNRFNLGEMSVTRCTLRISSGTCGVAYVQGRSHRRAEMAALADALLQLDRYKPILNDALLGPISKYLDSKAEQMKGKAQSTRVDFFTVSREAGVADNVGGDS